jgi:hypothetical protein
VKPFLNIRGIADQAAVSHILGLGINRGKLLSRRSPYNLGSPILEQRIRRNK